MDAILIIPFLEDSGEEYLDMVALLIIPFLEDSGEEYLDMDAILINPYLGDSGEEYLDMDAYMGPQEYSMCQPVYDSEEYSHSEVIHFYHVFWVLLIFLYLYGKVILRASKKLDSNFIIPYFV